MPNQNKNGFAVSILLIVTVITFSIAAVGWYVYTKNYEVVDSGGVAGIIKTVKTPDNDILVEENFDDLGDFKEYEYKGDKPAVVFEYPETWLAKDVNGTAAAAGVLVDVVSPEQHQKFLNGETKIDSDLFVSFWPNINNQNALGGSWDGQRQYANLDDYITDPNFGYKKSLKTTVIDSYKAHVVTIGGMSESYGIMIESEKGIFEFNFASTYDEDAASNEVKKIISTIDIQ